MKVAITGATGFIGKELLTSCPNDIEVLALTRKSIKSNKYIKYDDLFDVKAEHLVGCESFVHLAGVAHSVATDPETYTLYNTELVTHLAKEACKANIKRFIFISTIGVNGLNTDKQPFRPTDSVKPHNDYARSKYNAEQELQTIAKDTGLEVVIIRPVLVYGKEAPGSFSLLLKMISKFGILPFGLVKNKRSFISVQNLADFIVLCLKHEKAAGQIFLASDGKALSIRAFSNSIAKGPRAAGVSPIEPCVAGARRAAAGRWRGGRRRWSVGAAARRSGKDPPARHPPPHGCRGSRSHPPSGSRTSRQSRMPQA